MECYAAIKGGHPVICDNMDETLRALCMLSCSDVSDSFQPHGL